MTKKDKLKKIVEMVRRHGEIIVIYEDLATSVVPYYRRRKINKNGECYTSYLGHYNRRWTRYGISCFLAGSYIFSLNKTISLMKRHDKNDELYPIAICVGKRKIKL